MPIPEIKHGGGDDKYNVFEEGKKIRYNDRFKHEGTNVNFVNYKSDCLDIIKAWVNNTLGISDSTIWDGPYDYRLMVTD